MEIKQIDEKMAVAGQLRLEDVEKVAELGFRTIVANRPDSEDGAVPHAEIRAAAEKAGLAFHYVPVVPGAPLEAEVETLSEILTQSEGPVLAYCRSGTRSANLYRMAKAHQA